jgi:group II intron reverse transcriptase/maturase
VDKVVQPAKETHTKHVELENMMQTSLRGIANKAAQNKAHRFQNLISLLTYELLYWSWQFVNKRAAAGVDRETAYMYAQNLESHLADLAESVKGGWYRAKLVLRKYIPKPNGKLRPLGLPAIADKVLQMAVVKILEAIYEQDFLPCSFGYRPRMNAHLAIKGLSEQLGRGRYRVVVEADIKGFFDNINHDLLLEMLRLRIDDKPFLRLIEKWLKAGILDTDGKVLNPMTGTPQGGIVSPILANVYLHYVLDMWFETTVKAHCKGRAYLCRYADDFVCLFEQESDAQRFYQVLPLRLAKYGLEVAEDKTNRIPFDRGAKTSFEFLGFEFRWGLSRWGKPVLKRRTSRKKYRASLAAFSQWCKEHSRLPIGELIEKLNRKLRGYWNYYGIRGNFESMSDYLYHVEQILFKRLNQRSQRKSYTWNSFYAMLKDHPLVKPRICHSF